MRLKGKAALVTGAGGGLGGAISKRFSTEGASVLCTDRDLAAAEATAAAIIETGGTASAFMADVAEAGDCEAQVAETIQRHGRIDIAVNNAGVAMHMCMPASMDLIEASTRSRQVNCWVTSASTLFQSVMVMPSKPQASIPITLIPHSSQSQAVASTLTPGWVCSKSGV